MLVKLAMFTEFKVAQFNVTLFNKHEMWITYITFAIAIYGIFLP